MSAAIIYAAMGVALAWLSGWMHVRQRESGQGWGFVAAVLIGTAMVLALLQGQ